VAPFVDAALTPNIALGFSPQIIFRVKPDSGSVDSATEYDLRARLTARAPVSPSVDVFGRLSPAFSVIDLPSDASSVGVSIANPKGFLIDFSAGTEAAVQPNLFFVAELGYQVGFQSTTISGPSGSVDLDFKSRFLHFGIGLAVRL
jgi:hypothetical protein